MRFIFQVIKSMRCFFICAGVVLLIAVVLSHLTTHSLDENTLYAFVMRHHVFWILVRAGIILGFVLVWPHLVGHWARKYQWKDEHTFGIIRRRWRFAVWLVIIGLTFQLL